ELRAFYEDEKPTGDPTFEELTLDSDGTYTFRVQLDTKDHRAERQTACDGDEKWDHHQRVTIDNLSTGQSFSFDVTNPWTSGDSGSGKLIAEGIKAHRGDQLRVRYNLRTFGYVAIMGSGISVVDLNRAYRNPLHAGGSYANSSTECGRRLGKLEGQDVVLPAC